MDLPSFVSEIENAILRNNTSQLSILYEEMKPFLSENLAWQLWHKTQSIVADGQVTNTLEIPLPPIGYLMTASCAFCALVLIVKGVEAIKNP